MEVEQGKVSVILPAYNCQRFLPQCIDSVLQGQPSTDIELIIVNDGSDDSTSAIAKAYADSDNRVKVINKLNGGLSAARNCGIEASCGEFITFIDADDILLPGAINYMMSLMDDDTDVVSGRFYRGLTRSCGQLRSKRNPSVKVMDGHEAVVNMLYQRDMSCNAWGRIYRRSSIGDTRFTEGILYEDMDFNYRLFKKLRKLKFSSRFVYFYRIVKEGLTGQWSESRLCVMQVTSDIEKDAVMSHDPQLIAAARDRRLSAAFNMFALSSINGAEAHARSCWNEICRLRKEVFADKCSRMKNRLGILASYLGKDAVSMLSRFVYK